MRNVKNLHLGDVITASALSKDDYFLVVDVTISGGTDVPESQTYELINLGEDRFVDTVLGRQKRIPVSSVEDLGKVRRHARYVPRVTFSRA